MRILFVAYCMVNNENGDSLIGVYKRCLRIGLEMVRRGHEVFVFCTGREAYRDATIERAESTMKFIDFGLEALFCPSVEIRRRYYRRVFHRLNPQLVVVGEAPLAGTLLDSTLCAAGMGIPVVVLDNAYSPALAQAFEEQHGPMLDGLILTGPRSFQLPEPARHYCAAPPFISGSGREAGALLQELGLSAQRLITVLGYERKAETLAAALLVARPQEDCAAILLTPEPEEAARRLESLPETVRMRLRILQPPDEAVLFSLLAQSALAIGKCGFMQVSESLALGTPFIGVHYRGCFSVDMLHPRARCFIHSTSTQEADPETLDAFDRFLHLNNDEIRRLHEGGFDGLRQAADFLETLPHIPRRETAQETARAGFTNEIVAQSLAAVHPGAAIEVAWTRATRLRNYPQCRIDSVTAVYTTSGRRKQAFLWGRRYSEPRFAEQDRALAEAADSGRRILFRSEDGLLILEQDAGESRLPPLNI
ncbi:MAG TPA: hypothetical protein VKB88_45065 [Bryobacteraceae bacterium]|nr:hypothetical protein [Bryobacteraceae bacterium]